MSTFLTRPVYRKKPVLGDFFGMYQNRRYFIFTGGSTETGWPYTRMLLRKEDLDPNEYPNMVQMISPQPITPEIYYITCGQIDIHNRCLQESSDIEKIGYLILVKLVQPICFCDECGQFLVGVPGHH